jgi:hypothetical protein
MNSIDRNTKVQDSTTHASLINLSQKGSCLLWIKTHFHHKTVPFKVGNKRLNTALTNWLYVIFRRTCPVATADICDVWQFEIVQTQCIHDWFETKNMKHQCRPFKQNFQKKYLQECMDENCHCSAKYPVTGFYFSSNELGKLCTPKGTSHTGN